METAVFRGFDGAGHNNVDNFARCGRIRRRGRFVVLGPGAGHVLPGHNRSLQRARLQSDESYGRHIQHLRQHRRVGQAVIHAAFRGGRGPRPMGAGGVGRHQPQTEHRAAGRGPQRRQARGRRLRQLGIVAVQQDHVGPAAEKRLRAGQRQEPRLVRLGDRHDGFHRHDQDDHSAARHGVEMGGHIRDVRRAGGSDRHRRRDGGSPSSRYEGQAAGCREGRRKIHRESHEERHGQVRQEAALQG